VRSPGAQASVPPVQSGITVVTGAARGIGAATARALGRDGRRLLLCDLDGDALGDTARSLGADGFAAVALAGDLGAAADREALAAEVERAGGLAALAHVAGISGTMAAARRILGVNLVATAQLLERLLPLAREGSAAVCVASQAGHMVGRGMKPEIRAVIDDPLAPDFFAQLEAAAGPVATAPAGAYALSKWGVQRLVVAKAPAWGQRGARLVSLSPGIVDTRMGQHELAAHGDAMKAILEKTPVGQRMGRPEELAAVIAFLCSDAASFVSGVDWLVDGGSTHQVIAGVG
jgi:NAD(P)-dependent dehydrogenase (short-subunit alcohol dehydrogenase family)